MALTEFGKAVRSARVRAEASLQMMADALGTTPAFLSALETGRKNIPDAWVSNINGYLAQHGQYIPNLRQLADVSNKQVPVDGVSPAQQMLVAGFARVRLDDSQLKLFEKLLNSATKG